MTSGPVHKTSGTDEKTSTTIPSAILHDEDTTALWLSHRRPPRPVTYRMLQVHVRCLQTQLASAGVGHGDVVVLIMPNCYELIVAFMSIASQAAIILPLNPDLSSAECQTYLEKVPVKLLIEGDTRSGPGRTPRLQRIFPTCTHATLTIDADPVLEVVSGPRTTAAPMHTPSAQDLVLYLHTSGTTGPPKVVPLSHRNLLCGVRQVSRSCRLTAKDYGILVMPLFHIHGLVAGLLAPLMAGGSVVVRGRFTASTAIKVYDDIRQCGGTWYTAVPAIHRMVLEAQPEDPCSSSSLRFLRSCSAPMEDARLALERRFRTVVLQAYGMTEAGHQITSNSVVVSDKRRLRTVGQADEIEIRIINNNGHDVPSGATGQIAIRGHSVMTGYLGGHGSSQQAFSVDGFLHTGDQGTVDEAGFLTLTGRLKEFINRGGEKVNPYEIERRICGHAGVVDACAVPFPSSRYGEEVALHVVLFPSHRLTEASIRHYIGAGLAHSKVPSRVWTVPNIPRTSTGKLQRRRVVDEVIATLDREQWFGGMIQPVLKKENGVTR